jgi:hypothetical protein
MADPVEAADGTRSRAYPGHMADFSRFLPLSNRPREDESGVTSDRRAAIAELVDEAARILTAMDRAAASTETQAFLSGARLASEADATEADAGRRLSELADRIRRGRKRPVSALSRTLGALLRLAGHAGVVPHVSERTSGSVALYAVTTAPFDRRAVVAGHQLRATDADWAFGNGPVLEGTALGIVAFLLGISDDPPRRRSPGSTGGKDTLGP